MTTPPRRRPTRVGRLSTYLAVAFPPLPMLLGAVVGFAAVYFTLEAISFHSRLTYTWRGVGAIVTGYLVSLLLRLYDELKDVETDRRLAAAGDPKYMARPIVQGLVDVEDLQALRWTASAIALGVNALLGPVVLAGFCVLYATAWMSLHWYFWPKMREHLMVAFVTHNPLTLLLQAYGGLVYAADFGAGALSFWPLVATLIGQQGLASAWEIARKVRAPEHETDYMTYSRALGRRGATLLTAGFVVVSAGCLLWVGALAELHVVYLAAVVLAAVVVLVALLRFWLAPSATSSKLQPYVEGFAAVADLGGAIALVVRWGMTLAPVH